MLRFTKLSALFAAVVVAAMWGAAPAQAQATRTWISGVGDDANPCSRTAPCKTFAGAISKTAAGGEIDALDPGGFGAVTVTKSITLDGSGGSTAGILVSGTNGVVVNDSGAGTAQVTVRNIDFEGIGFSSGGPGLRGIYFLSGATLNVEHCIIRNFRDATNGTGISFTPSLASKLFVDDTVLTGNGNGSNGGGILIAPTAGVTVAVVLNNVRAFGNQGSALRIATNGLSGGGVTGAATHSVFSGSVAGVAGVSTAAGTPIGFAVNDSVISGNTFGVLGNGSATTFYLSGNSVTGNGTGFNAAGSSTINTYGDNLATGNTNPSSPTLPAIPKV